MGVGSKDIRRWEANSAIDNLLIALSGVVLSVSLSGVRLRTGISVLENWSTTEHTKLLLLFHGMDMMYPMYLRWQCVLWLNDGLSTGSDQPGETKKGEQEIGGP